jgi:hypothetical protein
MGDKLHFPAIFAAHISFLFKFLPGQYKGEGGIGAAQPPAWPLSRIEQLRPAPQGDSSHVHEEQIPMTNENIHLTPKPVDTNEVKAPVETKKQKEQEELDRIADEAAEKAGNRETRFDEDHGLISK